MPVGNHVLLICKNIGFSLLLRTESDEKLAEGLGTWLYPSHIRRYVGHGASHPMKDLTLKMNINFVSNYIVLHPLSNTQSQPTRQRVMYMLQSLNVAALLLPLQTTLDGRHVSKKIKQRVSDKARAHILLQLPGNEGTSISILLQ